MTATDSERERPTKVVEVGEYLDGLLTRLINPLTPNDFQVRLDWGVLSNVFGALAGIITVATTVATRFY